jgi:hypothetical protein
MSASSLANFCDKHNILWFPISLTINADKTKILNSIQHPLYNGRPKMTDFKDLDNSIIKQRQELIRDPYWAKILNTIAIDTSQIYHIDIDTPNYDEGFDKIAETTPYFKSMTKEYGKHILITANNFTGCIQTILQKITDYAFLPFYYNSFQDFILRHRLTSDSHYLLFPNYSDFMMMLWLIS